ncbi:hypothetical protein [Streptomyces californicus]|uniref:hypothetical protein n=1 Tax=Streptomyces californicus TaxID=67351 RepID=UPI00331FE309
MLVEVSVDGLRAEATCGEHVVACVEPAVGGAGIQASDAGGARGEHAAQDGLDGRVVEVEVGDEVSGGEQGAQADEVAASLCFRQEPLELGVLVSGEVGADADRDPRVFGHGERARHKWRSPQGRAGK